MTAIADRVISRHASGACSPVDADIAFFGEKPEAAANVFQTWPKFCLALVGQVRKLSCLFGSLGQEVRPAEIVGALILVRATCLFYGRHRPVYA